MTALELEDFDADGIRVERSPNFAVRAAAALAAAAVVIGAVAVLAGRDVAPPIDGARVELAGSASVIRAEGGTDVLADGDVVRAGDEVIVEDGALVLRLADGRVLEGRGPREGVAATRIEVGAVPDLLAGDVLLSGAAGTAVDAAGTVVSLTEPGAARVRRGLSVLAGVYEGEVDIESAGQGRRVPALRQLGIGSLGRPAARPVPFSYDAGDPWDQRYLGTAIDLGERLDGFARSHTANATTPEERSAARLRRLLPELAVADPDATLASDGARPAGDVLVGAAIAALASGPPVADRWDAVFSFRDDGAAWGLVALDQGVDGARLLDVVGAALSRSVAGSELAGGEVTGPAAPPVTPGAGGAGAGGAGGGGTGGGGATPTTPTTSPPGTQGTTPPPTTPTPTAPTIPTPTVPIPPGGLLPETGVPLLDGIVDPVDDILVGLLGP